MNVVVLGPSHPFRGGIAHHTTLLFRALAARGPARLVTFTRQYPGRLFPGATDRDASAEPLAAGAAEALLDPLDPRSWYATADSIAAGRPDRLVLPWWVPYWAPSYGAVARRVRGRSPATRIVYVCHNVVPHERAPLTRALTRWALAPGDAFVVHARAQAAALAALLPGRAVRITPHPLYDMFTPVAAGEGGRAAARAALGLPADAPVVLFFGFVRPYKGLEDLLAAVALARKDVRGLRLVVAGEFWGADGAARFGQQAQELGVAEALTLVDRYIPNEEVPRYFQAADVAALPYREATQSGVLAMAYGFGLPVVASTAGGLGEMVVDGVSGLLVPPGDPLALGRALARFFVEGLGPRLTAGVAARRGELSWERLAEVVEQV